ncbi:MAG: Crp/Fnr family transcriptional regulator [Filomicrobium sp.]
MSRGQINFDKLIEEGFPSASIPAGEKVFLQGDAGGTMYIVRSGAIDVLMFGQVLETVTEGGIVGEISLIDESPRSAAALAATNAEVTILDRPAFLELIKAEPDFAFYVLRTLSQRLRKLDALIGKN